MAVSTTCGLVLFSEMRATTDFTPIVHTLLREGDAKDEFEAHNLLEAFLQWIAMIPVVEPGKALVMLKTPVDAVFHAFILNTAFYQEFCERFFGFFIHHNPLGEETGSLIDEGICYTLELLDSHYGDNLHPALRVWREQVNAEAYAVSCTYSCDDMRDNVEARLPSNGILVH